MVTANTITFISSIKLPKACQFVAINACLSDKAS